MSTEQLLPGITQHRIKTSRIEIAYLEAGAGSNPIMLVHGNCSSSLFFQDFMLSLAATNRYTVYAPDRRGYGDSEALPVDATRGVRDFSDDLATFANALGLTSFHLLGWSLGGNIVMQYAIDYPGTLRSLTLEAAGSPFVQRIAQGDRGSEQSSPRTVLNNYYFKPTFQAAPDREEIYLTGLLSTRVGPGNYPGDVTPSNNWPNVAPGAKGVNNAISPKYLDQGEFANISHKPPVLWVHGADDQIVSDTSLFDLGFLGQLGAVPGWPGADVYPPQPMKTQLRTVLNNYQQNGGQFHEVLVADCGHSPHIEKQAQVLQLFTEFLDAHIVSAY